MSSHYRRSLLTTCVSVLAISMSYSSPSFAGFEWTPPEKKEVPAPVLRDVPPPVSPAPVIRMPVEEPEPVVIMAPEPSENDVPTALSPDVFEEEPESVIAVPEPNEKPVVQIKTPSVAIPNDVATQSPVLPQPEEEDLLELPEISDEEMMKPVVETVNPVSEAAPSLIDVQDEAEEVAEDIMEAEEITQDKPAVTVPVVIDDVSVAEDPDLEDALQELQDDKVPSLVREVTPDMPDEDVVEKAVDEAIEEIPAPVVQDNKLNIQPFPVTGRDNPTTQGAVVLPADSDVDMRDLKPEDVMARDEVKIQSPMVKEDVTWDIPEDFYTIDGFGSELPLALALRQIVPPQYAFAFNDVNAGQVVSWEGGKPWNEILAETLLSIDVEYTMKDKKIILRKMSQKPVMNDVAPASEVMEDHKQGALSDDHADVVELARVVSSTTKPETGADDAAEARLAHADVTHIVPKIQADEKSDAQVSPLDSIYGRKTPDPLQSSGRDIIPKPKPVKISDRVATAIDADAKKK